LKSSLFVCYFLQLDDHIFQNPWDKFRYSRTDAGQIGLGAPDAPRNDAGQKEVSVAAAHLKWPARITLTGVLTAGFVAGAEEDFRDEFVAASAQEHGFATVVADDGNGDLGKNHEVLPCFFQLFLALTYLLQHRRQCPTLAQSPPPRHRRIVTNQQVVSGRQANWGNVRREFQRLFQLHQRQVILVREEVVLGMDDFLGHRSFHVRQLFLDVGKVVLAHPDANLGGQQAGKAERLKAAMIGNLFTTYSSTQ
jgi:hypothetical protein